MTSQLIGLYSSVMGSGKTALTDTLVDTHGFTSTKFAGTLKHMIGGLLRDAGINRPNDYTDGPLKETIIPFFGVTCRYLMQTLGTEWGRNQVKDSIWVDVAKEKIRRLMGEGFSVVVDDVRFPNEYQAILDMGGKMVHVVRPGLLDATGHVSEGALDRHEFDLMWVNDGSLDQWKASTGRLLGRLSKATATA